MKKPSKSDPPQARKTYTPQAIQNRILEEHLKGKSNRQIAKITGRDRATVSRVLSRREMVEIFEEQRSRVYEMASKAVSVIDRTLDSNDQRIAASAAFKIAEATGILPKRIEVPEPERDRERDRDAVLGQTIRMYTRKAGPYSLPLPASMIEPFRWIQDYVKKTLDASGADGPEASLASTEDRES